MSKVHTLSKLSLAIALGCAAQTSWAEIAPADGATQVSRQQGVEIINIAKPSDSGLSHNKYNKYNVDKAGAVLNNSRQAGQSQLAGQLKANPHLQTQSATVILNEVISRNPSKIAGTQEIFGDKADYVLANPNGISVEGGGFINTPRASMVVGKPQVAEGQLQGYDVTGSNALTTNGKITAQGSEIDFIAPQVSINGEIKTEQGVNVIQGRNKLARAQDGALSITTVEKTGQVLDGKIAGSMQAGRIRIHSTDDRATITAQGADLEAKEVAFTGANTVLKGDVQRNRNQGQTSKGRQGTVNVMESNGGSQEEYRATRVKTDKLTIQNEGLIAISGANIEAKETKLQGAQVHLGSEKTTQITTHRKHQNKGSWYRNEQDSHQQESAHRTNIQTEQLNIVANKGKVTAEGAVISLTNGAIYGEQGIQMRGVKSLDQQNAQADFRNETAKLATGTSSQESKNQHYDATELKVKENLILGSKGDMQLAGVVGQVDGDLIAKNTGALKFTAEKTSESYNLDDDQKFWGGLAGAKTLGSGHTSETVHGADFTVQGKTVLDAQNGVQISGSRVVSQGEGIVQGNQGKLVIDSVQATETQRESSRQGTIFNITKARSENYQHTSTAKGSTLASETNLALSSDKSVKIIGSNVQSAGLLEIAAKSGIEIAGAANSHQQHSSSAGFNLGLTFQSLQADAKHDHFNHSLTLNNSNGNLNGKIQSAVTPDKADPSASATVKFSLLDVYKKQSQQDQHSYSAANVSGADVNLNASEVTVRGSQVNAKEGSININAEHIRTLGQTGSNIHNSNNDSAHLGLTLTANTTSVTAKAGLTVDHQAKSELTQETQGSQLNAAEDIRLTGKTITHQGSQLSAGHNIEENAQQVNHQASQNSHDSFAQNAHVDISASAGVNKDKAFNVNVGIAANGGHSSAQGTQHNASQLQAGKNIQVNAQQINDAATQYQAAGDVVLNSQEHKLNAVINNETSNEMKAGANLNVSASTKDFNSATLTVGVGASYQQGNNHSEKAQSGKIQADNIRISTDKLHSQSDLQASGDIDINARQGAVLNTADNRQSQRGGGFNASAEVGAFVVPAAGTAVPSINVNVSANGQNSNKVDANHQHIDGKNVHIQSEGNVQLTGTQVNAAENLTLAGNNIRVDGAQSHADNVAVNVGAGVAIGANVSNLGINGNLKVETGNSLTHENAQLNGKNVKVQANQGIDLNAVSSKADNLTLDAGNGNLNLQAEANKVNKTNVDLGLNLSGKIADQQWQPAAGSAHLKVENVRNETHNATTLTAENAQINANGNANYIGSTIQADKVSGNIGGNSLSQGLNDNINETSVNLSASGSGKLTLPIADKWQESAKNDWNNGTIAGVKADAAVDVSVKKETRPVNAGVQSANDHSKVQGQKQHIAASSTKRKNAEFHARVTTQLKKRVTNDNKPIVLLDKNFGK